MTAPWLIKKPTTPSQWDDEFESDELDPKWTRVSPAGNTFVSVDSFDPYNVNAETINRECLNRVRRSWLMSQPASTSFTNEGYVMDISGAPSECFFLMRFTANVRRASIPSADGEVGMRLYDSLGTDAAWIFYDTFTNINEGLFRRNIGGVESNLSLMRNYLGEGHPMEYLGLQKRNNSYDGWIASSVGNWVWMGNVSFGVGQGVFDKVLVHMNNVSVAAPGRTIVGCDFFRVYSGRGPF